MRYINLRFTYLLTYLRNLLGCYRVPPKTVATKFDCPHIHSAPLSVINLVGQITLLQVFVRHLCPMPSPTVQPSHILFDASLPGCRAKEGIKRVSNI